MQLDFRILNTAGNNLKLVEEANKMIVLGKFSCDAIQ